jgi:alkanesulfonate monooxygenase SsuD/methylene tetrahydromethanopterin reductase-like flavin-dependent oxidoreductase (luciferase family)
MTRELTELEAAHARAVVALLNTIPDATEEEAEEVVESFTALVLYTIKAFLPEGERHDSADYN